jgi:acyl-coenzyme A thioesterase 13
LQSDEDPDGNFLIPWLKKLEIVEAEMTGKTTTRILYRFPILREYLNPTRTFHGGAIAAFFDVCTTWTLFPISDFGFWATMVSGVGFSFGVVVVVVCCCVSVLLSCLDGWVGGWMSRPSVSAS